ncbi:uroporphyrin-III C-methyltransferase [Catalinimonas alkaloidigena]|uniref:uroporphyrinogen-III C-methyltransferase n=1 Tax=Catalinimonas alkaloidigena TaxID=1075417 RepID=UPI002405AD9C|nr:uroporphyrinogen-III C-methyltransferase [Catalinimonas alkaloidigena]MDF9796697.1 uroporphyrin-III C-methyltransferase [Catalinimonas alkaloidigena]
MLNQEYVKPRLSLVGAGPGDPELITLKGIRALETADVVLYDALANDELLKYVPENVPRIYVGKRAGSHRVAQEDINRLIVSCARQYGHVVRLKGGDPYIFGRGHEEQIYAEQAGIAVSLVPGISSVNAVPALQSIPLTRRGLSESFWVITGTTRKGTISNDVRLAAQSSATIVILMGMSRIEEIQQTFLSFGKADTPVAIIQNGSMPDERVGVSNVREMKTMAAETGLASPAVIIIGEVVALHPAHIAEAVKRELALKAEMHS